MVIHSHIVLRYQLLVQLNHHTMGQFTTTFQTQKKYFSTDITKSYEWRIEQLNRLSRLLKENQDVLCDALGKDFKTVRYEQIFEVLALLGTIENVKSRLKTWMLPEETDLKQALKD